MNRLLGTLAWSPRSAPHWVFVSPTVQQKVDQRTYNILYYENILPTKRLQDALLVCSWLNLVMVLLRGEAMTFPYILVSIINSSVVGS